jgi:hypothetical protein
MNQPLYIQGGQSEEDVLQQVSRARSDISQLNIYGEVIMARVPPRLVEFRLLTALAIVRCGLQYLPRLDIPCFVSFPSQVFRSMCPQFARFVSFPSQVFRSMVPAVGVTGAQLQPSQLSARCDRFAAYCIRHTAHCTAHCTLHTAHCTLQAVRCVLCFVDPLTVISRSYRHDQPVSSIFVRSCT